MKRRFSDRQRAALFLAADGRCTNCDTQLEEHWHADHVIPYSRGGPTDVINGQALCPTCNLKKGSSGMFPKPNRQWQQDAINRWFRLRQRDFLVGATPAAGKTHFSIMLARQLLDEGTIERVDVVVPSDQLRAEWVENMSKAGIMLKRVDDGADYDKDGFKGCVCTYAQLNRRFTGSELLRRAVHRVPTLAIMDELHHAGQQQAWGAGLKYALEYAKYRLALTGTPWRQDESDPIPFVRYGQPSDSERARVVVDYAYEYGQAVTDLVCRRVEFHAYDGEARWRECGEIFSARLGEDMDDDDVSAALRALYNPRNQWIPSLFRVALEALEEIRFEVADAGMLVLADDMQKARDYARLLEAMGTACEVALSDDGLGKEVIERFKDGATKVLVAVRMVSEGVDIPRLAVAVYASMIRTPLFFRQVTGRIVRRRDGEEVNARMFIPAVPALMRHAREIEEELRHELEEAKENADREAHDGTGMQRTFDLRDPLSAGEAEFDRAILGGEEVTPLEIDQAAVKCREWGVPVCYAANIARGLRKDVGPVVGQIVIAPKPQPSRDKYEKALRGAINSLVNKIAHRRGEHPKDLNTKLLKIGFSERKSASVEELERLRAFLENELVEAQWPTS